MRNFLKECEGCSNFTQDADIGKEVSLKSH